MKVIVSKAPTELAWKFEAAFFDEERDRAISDLQAQARLQPGRAFELQSIPDHAFSALTAALPTL